MKPKLKTSAAVASAAVAGILLVACGGSSGDTHARLDAAQACAALTGQAVAGARVTSAEVVAQTSAVPAYCNAVVAVEPSLVVEMRIPQSWNGKLHYGGGGGFNGFIGAVFDAVGGGGTDADNHGLNLAALRSGYINISSDGGHKGKIPGAEAVDGSWVPGNAAAESLYAGDAIPRVMDAATALIQRTYGARQTRSYFEGCSNGGREALISAQKYPALFDGVIARAPASNFVASVGAFHANMRATVLDQTLNFTTAKVQLLSRTILNACDGLDGVADGLVSNTAACTATAASIRTELRCAGGADLGNTCLSDAQLNVVDTWNNPRTSAGQYTSPGYPLTGNESASDNWDGWLFGGKQFAFQYGAISGFILKDPATQPLPPSGPAAVATLFFNFDDPANAPALARFSATGDALNANLNPFMSAGRKLILWHGSADPALSVRGTTGYYRNVVAAVGGQPVADTFARYYVAPGVNHCHGGAGADKSDLLAALDAWVERGVSPSALSASRQTAGAIDFSRPLCPHPTYPRYVGPPNDAAAARLASNFTCTP